MKKALTLLLIVITCLLVGCSSKEKKKEKTHSVENISMVIKEGTLTRTGATIIITDNNDKHFDYGEPFRIDKKVNGKWEELKMADNVGFNFPAYVVDENNQLEMDLDWTIMYGKLEDGEYRIVKYVCVTDGCTKTEDFYGEFTIDGINSSLFNDINPEIQERIKNTKKIDVYSSLSHDKKVKEIDKEEEVKNMINLLMRATKDTNPNHTSEGHMLYLKLYDKDNTFLADIYVWKNNAIGFKNDKEYKLDTSSIIKLLEE